ncbi:hypothetical protein D3C79_766160 [compost metagenome]
MPAEDFLQVQVRAEGELVAVARGLVVVVATVQVTGNLTDIIEGEVIALFQQLGAGAAPVAGHPLRFAGKSLGSLRAAASGHRQRCEQGERT